MSPMKNLLERRDFSFRAYTLTTGPGLEVSRDSQNHSPPAWAQRELVPGPSWEAHPSQAVLRSHTPETRGVG